MKESAPYYNYDFTKHFRQFKILMESNRNGVHFALVKTVGNSYIHDLKEGLNENLPSDLTYLRKENRHLLLWGPEDDLTLESHGLSPLVTGNSNWSRTMSTEEAVRAFMKLVNDSDNQGFQFKKGGRKGSSLHYEKYPDGKRN